MDSEQNVSQPETNRRMLEGLCVCLVEDDISAIKVYSKWLTEAGATIVAYSTFADFQEAISSQDDAQWCSTNAPKIAMTDLVLPDGGGLEVVSLWKKHYPSRPILVLTAFATVENAVECMKMGAFDFLRKPIQEEELVLVLRRAADYVSLLEENETLASSVRVLGMAQTLSQISDRVSLLRTFGRLMHRETKADECFVFHYEVSKTHPECLLECRLPGLPRVAPEIIYSNLLVNFLAQRSASVQSSLSSRDEISLSANLNPTVHELPKEGAMIVELRSQTGNLAFVVLLQQQPRFTLNRRNAEILPIIVQASRGFQNADVATTLSFVDDLTGLYNQRFLFAALKNEAARASRYGSPVSVLFIDLDKFKQINDTHGHIVGSQILRESAHIFKGSVRESDFLLRYGGDEFVAVLPNTGLQGAMTVAERIRASFASTYFDVREKTGVPTAYNLNVTTSIGVAALPECASDIHELVQKADDAMYASKRAGKNCVSLVSAL